MSIQLEGYPDYARVGLTSGYLLAGGNKDITANTLLFKGYVGSWGFINEYSQPTTFGNYYSLKVSYWTDATFTLSVANQISVRGNNTIAYRQRAVLTPWVTIEIAPLGTHAADTVWYAFYGSNERANSSQLASLDVGGLNYNATLAAGALANIYDAHIIPGPATLSIKNAAGLPYHFELIRYDAGSLNYTNFFGIDNHSYAGGGTFVIGLPDAPYQANITNGGTASGQFTVYSVPH